MKVMLIGDTQGVFKVEVDAKNGNWKLTSEGGGNAWGDKHYLPEIIEMLQEAQRMMAGPPMDASKQ